MNDYIANFWIDSIQNAKKTFVDAWIKEESMSKPLNDFVDAQTAFTKVIVKTSNDFANATGEAVAKMVK